jgi:hypothetical protein
VRSFAATDALGESEQIEPAPSSESSAVTLLAPIALPHPFDTAAAVPTWSAIPGEAHFDAGTKSGRAAAAAELAARRPLVGSAVNPAIMTAPKRRRRRWLRTGLPFSSSMAVNQISSPRCRAGNADWRSPSLADLFHNGWLLERIDEKAICDSPGLE